MRTREIDNTEDIYAREISIQETIRAKEREQEQEREQEAQREYNRENERGEKPLNAVRESQTDYYDTFTNYYRDYTNKYPESKGYDETTRSMFMTAYSKQYECQQEINKEYKETNHDIHKMRDGEWKSVRLQDDTINIHKNNGEYHYFDNKQEISKEEFENKLKADITAQKEEKFGIQENLYELQAGNGSKIVAVDAQKDKDANNITSQVDSFNTMNFYREDPAGRRTQITGNEVEEILKKNGVTKDDIRNGRTKNLESIDVIDKTIDSKERTMFNADKSNDRHEKFMEGIER